MNASQLRSRIRRHNALQIGLGLLALAGAPLLWYLSFWVLRILFLLALSRFLGEKAVALSFWIATAGTILLVLEGLREGYHAFSLADVPARPRTHLATRVGPLILRSVGGYGSLLTSLLLVAPQVTLAGLRLVTSAIRTGPFTIDQAVHIYNDLTERREWLDPLDYPGSDRAVSILRQLRLIWTQGDEDDVPVRIRIPPGAHAPAQPSP